MLKIFLVEDEIIVREGIKNNINWQENGYFFCGEASDGELAFPMIQKLKPDIVITDIRMPFLDGLQLSRLIRLEMPWIKIIILSGYGEFEYAKQAIDIGITKYLLKPINGTELLSCMKLVGEDIYNEQREKANLDKFKREMKEYELDERRRLFHDMVSNEQSLAHILVRGNELNLELSAMAYNIILFTMKFEQNENVQYDNYIMKVRCELEELFEKEEDIIKFDFLIEGMALLIKGGSMREISEKQDIYIKHIKKIMTAYPIGYFGGIGIPVTRLGELSHSYNEASRALAYRYIWSTSEILDCSMLVKDGVTIDDFDTRGMVHEIISKDEKLMINKAKAYICNNYFNDEISLNQVAASVYISPNHLSAIFRKKTGETFIKYLTDLRMNKAKEMLRCTDMRTSEVGYAVGYKDPQYFSFLFKKTQNCTPKQYRYDSCKRSINVQTIKDKIL